MVASYFGVAIVQSRLSHVETVLVVFFLALAEL